MKRMDNTCFLAAILSYQLSCKITWLVGCEKGSKSLPTTNKITTTAVKHQYNTRPEGIRRNGDTPIQDLPAGAAKGSNVGCTGCETVRGLG
jgi:hypothetical protein